MATCKAGLLVQEGFDAVFIRSFDLPHVPVGLVSFGCELRGLTLVRREFGLPAQLVWPAASRVEFGFERVDLLATPLDLLCQPVGAAFRARMPPRENGVSFCFVRVNIHMPAMRTAFRLLASNVERAALVHLIGEDFRNSPH